MDFEGVMPLMPFSCCTSNAGQAASAKCRGERCHRDPLLVVPPGRKTAHMESPYTGDVNDYE
eukprot:2871961-Amphidinium_carterae.1